MYMYNPLILISYRRLISYLDNQDTSEQKRTSSTSQGGHQSHSLRKCASVHYKIKHQNFMYQTIFNLWAPKKNLVISVNYLMYTLCKLLCHSQSIGIRVIGQNNWTVVLISCLHGKQLQNIT